MISPELARQIEEYKEMTWPIVLDRPGTHSEFTPKLDGTIMHGVKRDHDRLDRDSPEFDFWCATMARFMHETCSRMDVLVGVARGANSLAVGVGKKLQENHGRDVLVVPTIKPESVAVLGEEAEAILRALSKNLAIREVEDEGTTGTTSCRIGMEIRALGFGDVEVIHSSQRQARLRFLDEAVPPIPYSSMIVEPLDTFEASECGAVGLCSQDGMRLIPYGSQ